MHQISAEAKEILKVCDLALNILFNIYLDEHKKWSDSEVVRDLEHGDNLIINRLDTLYRKDIANKPQLKSKKEEMTYLKLMLVEKKLEPWHQLDR